MSAPDPGSVSGASEGTGKKGKEKEKQPRRIPKPGWFREAHSQQPGQEPQVLAAEICEEIVDDDGSLKFALYRPGPREFTLDQVEYKEEVPVGKDEDDVLVPIDDKVVREGHVVLPGRPLEYGSDDDLFKECMGFVDRWGDLRETGSAEYTTPGLDLKIFVAYIMTSWLMGRVDAYPLLNLRGPSDVGKTRIAFLGHLLSYRSIRGSGASSYASLCRIADVWRGNLYVNEGDLQLSAETSETIKFLNARYSIDEGGVWKCEATKPGRWKTETFNVFGPTIITCRRGYDDDALESRCYRIYPKATTRMDIPLNLPSEVRGDARALRCKLLAFRFRNLPNFKVDPYHRFEGVQTRLSQITQPIACLAKKCMPSLYTGLLADIRAINEGLTDERANSEDGCVVRGYLFSRMESENVTALMIRNKVVERIGRAQIEVTPEKIGRRLRGLDFRQVRARTVDRARIVTISWPALWTNVVKYVPRSEREQFYDFLVLRTFFDMKDPEKKMWQDGIQRDRGTVIAPSQPVTPEPAVKKEGTAFDRWVGGG